MRGSVSRELVRQNQKYLRSTIIDFGLVWLSFEASLAALN